MDHRVSKDMISSGMTPSGEKSQADLGKTQYGSAPSPNKLMDAYHSMYQDQKEQTLDEEGRNIFGSTPQLDKVEKIKKYKENADRVLRNKKPESPNDNTKNLNNSVDLLAAYRAVYEHHKKDEDGNTIPHEDDVKEGKIPAGLQAYLDKKKGKKKDDDDNGDDEKEGKKKDEKDVKEGVDLFDVISGKFINEGYDEKDVYKAMSSLTEEQLQNIDEAIPLVGAALTKLAGLGFKGALKKGAAFLAKQGAGRQGLKNVATAFKNPTMGNVAKAAGNVGSGAIDLKFKTDVAKSILPGGGGGGSQQQPSNTISKTGRRTSTPVSQYSSTDLFDIVKGQLLDEGLSEEEIKDIMLTLTPEEILNEMGRPKFPAGRGADYRETPKPKPQERLGTGRGADYVEKPKPKPGELGSKYDEKGRKRYTGGMTPYSSENMKDT